MKEVVVVCVLSSSVWDVVLYWYAQWGESYRWLVAGDDRPEK